MISLKRNAELSSWQKAYWYLRILVNTDRYGGANKSHQKLKDLVISSNQKLKNDDFNDIKTHIETTIKSFSREGTKKYIQFNALAEELSKYFSTLKDVKLFLNVIEFILIPTNEAISTVPSTEAGSIAQEYAQTELDSNGESALANLIREWDVITEELCLNREREILNELIKNVTNNFSNLSKNNLAELISATSQEFERRVGQKRKQRAGNDLESATDFILKYFKFQSAEGPMHFNAGIEVDNWIKDKRGWYIGISLKRTLRERWKQTQTTESVLTSFKIKNIIHLINNDQDLSDSKIADMGANRHLFFVADSSNVLNDLKDHPALSKFIFPMSELIQELKKLSA
ncbi:MAG: hypothetical protein ACPGJV_08385 [Bacteriovoracaceae bacterium]